MRKHSNGHQVVVLNEDNFQQYVKLPKVIIDRFTEHKADKNDLKNITLDQTKISDVVRTYLLYYYDNSTLVVSIQIQPYLHFSHASIDVQDADVMQKSRIFQQAQILYIPVWPSFINTLLQKVTLPLQALRCSHPGFMLLLFCGTFALTTPEYIIVPLRQSPSY